MKVGFMLLCPWRIEKKRCEYWTRYQFGPFYILRGHGKAYWDQHEREMDALCDEASDAGE